MLKQVKAKQHDVINQQNCNFKSISYIFGCSQNATNPSKSTVELGYMCNRGLFGPPAVTLFSIVFKVWIDIENMQGSTLAAMAKAVEDADIVLVCFSQRYKDSANCRAGKGDSDQNRVIGREGHERRYGL